MKIYRESAWTRPRDDCPHPERWSSTDSDSTEIEVSELVSTFVRALQPDRVVETGTCFGQTSWMIGLALKANGQGHLDTIEIDEERVAIARERCDGLPVTVHAMSSLEFTPSGPVGFAWFDSLFQLRIPEFERLRPHLTEGAIVGFHDTAPHHGWGHQVENLPGTQAIRLRTPRGVTFLQVTA